MFVSLYNVTTKVPVKYNTIGFDNTAADAVGADKLIPNPCIAPPDDDSDTMDPLVMLVTAVRGMPKFCEAK
jgi:hypothetical protein